MPDRSSTPSYDQLLAADPPGSAWAHFGAGDQLGTINFLTPDRVASAARLIRTGKRFGLDHEVTAFEPYPTGTRKNVAHHVFANNEFHRDDWIDSFYLQSSSQIDALRQDMNDLNTKIELILQSQKRIEEALETKR